MTEATSGPDTSPGQGQPSTQDTGTSTGEDPLAVSFSELARSLEYQDDSDDVLAGIVKGAIELIPGVQEASISVVTARKHVHSTAPSSDLPRRVDEIQAETGQGPCIDAVYDHRTVRVPDMGREERWPLFAARALHAGAGSMLSFQLYVQGDNLGALNLYADKAGAFDDESEHVGLLFAAHAAIAYAGVMKLEQLTSAVQTRDLIGQAKGILMQRHTISSDEAFALLTKVSQVNNTKLREVAQHLVGTADLAAASRRRQRAAGTQAPPG